MNKFKFLKISTALPESPGVYAFKKEKSIVYIGKAVNIRERIKSHKKLLGQAEKIGYIKTGSEIEALILEAKLIKKYKPKYNTIWKDDKNYFFVALTKEKSPRIFITHQTEQNNNCLGPFVDGSSLKQSLTVLRKAFPFRTCQVLPKKPCLWRQLNLCPAPCILKTEAVCRRNAKNISRILRGEKNQVLKSLKKEMKLASKKQDYEKAARIRNKIFYLENIIKKADTPDLASMLKGKKPISKIEAYDISNIQGKEATGSMAVFIEGRPNKNLYRRFKIKIQGKPNDTAMIKEIIGRRMNHKEWPYPDLILIDGGKAQLNAAAKAKTENIKIISLAKKENKLFVENRKNPILLKSLSRETFNLILHLRDEAHRFAIAYHRKLRAKALLEK